MFLCKAKQNLHITCGKNQAFRKKLTLLKSVLSRLHISAEHFPQLAKVAGRSCNVKEHTLVLDSLTLHKSRII